MRPLRIGVVPLARTTFDIPLAEKIWQHTLQALTSPQVSVLGPDGLITDVDSAYSTASTLSEAPPDLLVILQATFADSTMVTTLAERIDSPILLWAVPEERTGGRLRLNSLCGINLAAHALTLRGQRYSYVYAPPGDPAAHERVLTRARAGQVYQRLKSARLGVFGQHPDGMDTCRLDAAKLQETLGITAVQMSLNDLFSRVNVVLPGSLSKARARFEGRLTGLGDLPEGPLQGTLSAYSALKQISEEENFAGIAVRCWPEFFTELGCAACGAMSMLSDEQIPCSCEADVNGTVTQLILQWLSGEPAFGSDLVSFDFDKDNAVLWHCGLAPVSMADPDTPPRGGLHSNRRLPLVMEFPLKPGKVTIARLSQATGNLRLVVGRGEMLAAPSSFSGTSGVIRFERPARQVLDTILLEGLEHHLSITYGDHVQSLVALADMLHVPVLHLT